MASTQIKVHEQKLETVTSFKYLGAVIFDEGSKPEILSRMAQKTAALTQLTPVWNDRCCAPFSQSSFCILANHEPEQQNCKEEYEPWK